MIVLKVEVNDLNVLPVDAKRNAPVFRDEKTPYTLAVACQPVRLPACNGVQFVLMLHVLQEQDNTKDFIHSDRRHARTVITP
jgi:hypothetical protein